MLLSPVVILVGGPNTGKTKFYTEFTTSAYNHPTTQSIPSMMTITPPVILIDTPGNPNLRTPQEYSWQGIFQYADVILDFGNWSEDEILGTKQASPKYMTWSGDNQETLKRVQDYLQGR